MKGILTF